MNNGLTLLIVASACFLGGYFLYSRFLGKVLGIDPSRKTPAHTRRDGVDYVPAHPTVLFGHHFAAIAGAGPIVGPVLAAEFGWASVALWIILGCIFIGAAHDMIALFLSVRHDGESIGTVIGSVLGTPGRILFLLFSWSALVLVLAEFTRQIAATFVADPAIATASLLFIGEAIVFGFCVYRLRMPVLWASLIFVPIMFAFVWVGNAYPFDVCALFGLSKEGAQGVWTIVLLIYCFFASTMPVWLLLQPRDYLNSYLLYAMLAIGLTAVFIVCPTINIDAFAGFTVKAAKGGATMYLFPLLFVTVACGACSGFHALVASGTSAKQLDNEKSIRPIAYGGMLLEGVLAIIALIGVAGTYMSQKEYVSAVQTLEPVQMFASTIAGFCVTVFAKLGIAPETGKRIAESFMLLSVSAFLMTTVDAGTRLARFSWQELVACLPQRKSSSTSETRTPEPGTPNSKLETRNSKLYCIFHNMYVGTTIVCALAAALLLGNPKAAKSLWTIFASANQLLASLTLLTATLWFVRNKKPCWFTLVPMCFMLSVSSYALISIFTTAFGAGDWTRLGATGFLLLVAVALVLFTLSKVFSRREQ